MNILKVRFFVCQTRQTELITLTLSFSIAESNVTIVKGIRGLESGVLFENLMPSFLEVIKSEKKYLSRLNFYPQAIYLVIYQCEKKITRVKDKCQTLDMD